MNTDIIDIDAPFRSYSFRGGLRTDVDPAELAEDQLMYLENGRVRDGSIAAIRAPLEIDEGLPNGHRQGLYTVGNLLLAFVDGRAFFKNLVTDNNPFLAIENFQLSATADRIYICAVPTSTINYKRATTDNDNATAPLDLVTTVPPSPAAIVCQDGVTQPLLIINQFTFRSISTIDTWDPENNREYVPIGLDMIYYSGKLYIVSVDRKEIYQSVTGRPLDFVIAVKEDGNRLDDLPENGIEASRLSHAVDYETITSIAVVSGNEYIRSRIEDTFTDFFIVYATDKTYAVAVDTTSTIYGEPRFRNKFLFPTNALSQFAQVDLLGDTAFVDLTGLKSFNSILSLDNEGVNSEFSRLFTKYFNGITQDVVACGAFDNYALFAVKTVFGYKIIIFDVLSKKFVSVDDWGLDSPVFAFAQTKINNVRRLFFMTDDAKVYEAFADDAVLPRMFTTKEFIGEGLIVGLKPTLAKVLIQNPRTTGTITATSIVDRLNGRPATEDIDAVNDNFTSEPPFGTGEEDSVVSVDFGFIHNRSGAKIAMKFVTDVDCEIFLIEIYCTAIVSKTSLETQGKAYA